MSPGFRDRSVFCPQGFSGLSWTSTIDSVQINKSVFFPSLRTRLQAITTEDKKIKLMTKLLGEEGLTSGRKISREIQSTIEYLSCILPKRSACIAERKGDM